MMMIMIIILMLPPSMLQHRRMLPDGALTIWGTINNPLLLLLLWLWLLFWCCLRPRYSIAARIRMGKKVEKALSKDKNHSSASHETNDDDPNKTPGQGRCFRFQRRNAFVSFSLFLTASVLDGLSSPTVFSGSSLLLHGPNKIPDQWRCFSFWNKNAFVSFSFRFFRCL